MSDCAVYTHMYSLRDVVVIWVLTMVHMWLWRVCLPACVCLPVCVCVCGCAGTVRRRAGSCCGFVQVCSPPVTFCYPTSRSSSRLRSTTTSPPTACRDSRRPYGISYPLVKYIYFKCFDIYTHYRFNHFCKSIIVFNWVSQLCKQRRKRLGQGTNPNLRSMQDLQKHLSYVCGSQVRIRLLTREPLKIHAILLIFLPLSFYCLPLGELTVQQ
jgi:hypothetical protein